MSNWPRFTSDPMTERSTLPALAGPPIVITTNTGDPLTTGDGDGLIVAYVVPVTGALATSSSSTSRSTS